MNRCELIVALDPPYPGNQTSEFGDTVKIVKELGDSVSFYKVGMRLFDNFGSITRFLLREGKNVFLDFKLSDIPSTIIQTIKSISKINDQFATDQSYIRFISLTNLTPKSLSSVIQYRLSGKDDIEILYVPSLTSSNEPNSKILSQSEGVLRIGCSGIVCPGNSVKELRGKFYNAVIVVPGIRPIWADIKSDDQIKMTTPEQAAKDGANYIVVGRPIIQADDIKDAAEKIIKEINV
jgi:orotidine-5'-phosphate decarboxylase